jgi:hypothetical protein
MGKHGSFIFWLAGSMRSMRSIVMEVIVFETTIPAARATATTPWTAKAAGPACCDAFLWDWQSQHQAQESRQGRLHEHQGQY